MIIQNRTMSVLMKGREDACVDDIGHDNVCVESQDRMMLILMIEAQTMMFVLLIQERRWLLLMPQDKLC